MQQLHKLKFMENTAFPLFAQQLFRRIYILFTIMVIIISMILFLFWKSENNRYNLNHVQLPHWQKNTKIIIKKQQIQTIISQLLLEHSALNYKKQHQQLQLFLQQFSALFLFKNALFNDILEQNKMLDTTVYRLVQSNMNNEQIKAETQIELHLILLSLKDLTLQKQQQQQLLYQQIVQTKITDTSTITKIKFYTRATQQLLALNHLQQLFMTLANNINHLSILSSPLFLNKITTQSKQALLNQHALVIDNVEKNNYVSLNEQISRLDELLFKKQLLIAKWRDALRYAQRYHQSLKNWVYYFNKIKSKPFQPKGKHPLSKQQLIVFIQQYYPDFSSQNLLWLIIYIVIFWLCLSFIFLSRLKIQLRHNVQKLLQWVQSNSTTKGTNEPILSPELEHSFTLLAQHTRCGYWSLPWSAISNQQTNLHLVLTENLPDESKLKKSWRYYFSIDNQRLLLKQARLAKQQLKPQQIVLKLKLNTPNVISVKVIIYYENNHFFGCLQNISELETLQQNIAGLKQTADTQAINITQYLNEEYSNIDKNIAQLMLIAQKMSICSDNTNTLHQLYCSLLHVDEQSNYNRLVGTSVLCPKRISVAPPFSAFLNLQPTNFYNEVYTATLNANNISTLLNNHIYLNYQTELLPLVTLDSQLFQQTICLICAIMLAQQERTDLLCQFNLHDKHSGQQIVHCSFTLLNQPNDLIEKSLTTLSYCSLGHEKFDQNIPLSCSALNILLTRLQIKNVNSLQSEQGVIFQFDLPLALSQPQQSTTNKHLLHAHYLLISADESLSSHVKEVISDNHGQCHYLRNAKHLVQHYSIEQLTKHPIESIILAPDCYASGFDLITSYINALPKSLQPKLLVLQSPDNLEINQQGFYSLAMCPLPQNDLIEALQTLKKSKSANNQLLSLQQCQATHFKSSCVKVLVAVKNQNEQHQLQRLLQWLGLQVTVVANESSLIQQWQSGHFLLLFTNFASSPFIELKLDHMITRGLFFLAKFNEKLSTTEQKYSQNWQIFQLENYLNIKQLTQQLTPWLLKKEQLKRINLLPDQINEQPFSLIAVPTPFNLNTFVQNQGSIALAVYMIDEYLQTIVSNSQLLTKAFSENNRHGFEKALLQLLQTSSIIAATDLHCSCVALQKAWQEKNCSSQERLIDKIDQQIVWLLDYAKAI